LADRRHDTAEEAAALQSKQQELERLRLRLGTARAHVDGIDKALAHAQSHWATRMQALGLSDMTLEQMGPWCTAREQVLSADEHLAEARSELEGLRHRVADADAKLSKALPSAAPAGADLNLNALVRHAADLTEQASRVRTRGDSLREQRDNAAALLATLEDALHQATERLARWQEDWRNCLGALNLPAETGTEAAEQALATLSDMDQHLAKRQELMDARIRPMERDLQRFADAALALAADLDPGLSGSPPADISRVLNERLTQAQRDARDRERLSGEIDEARREAEREARAQTQAKAELQPLLWTPSAALFHRCFRQGPSRTSSGWR
jgi:chromosome segregation ATPase